MDREPDGLQVMSLRLSRVLTDIGVTRQMVARRRRTFLMLEKIHTVSNTVKNTTDCDFFIFGSQTEGTTTLGMDSDIDMVQCVHDIRVILDMADWEPTKRCLLVLKTELSPPQHCCLLMLRKDCPLPKTLDMVPAECNLAEDMDGRVLLPNTWADGGMKQEYGRLFKKQGPSRSAHKDLDFICALSYSGLLFECNFLFTRPKPGHWPRPEVLVKARQCDTYLVAQGHAESDQSKLDWRFSTSQIERLLMFDLNILQIQVYTFLKIIRKSFFKPLVGDRLSTFHFKTALFFTLETYPPEIWQEHKMLQCVIYCLKTLQRWFKHRYCPHYTIAGVDLFVGKLRKWEFPLLSSVLSKMIDNIMDYVSKIEMDQIGDRICNRHIEVCTRYQNTIASALYCFRYDVINIFHMYWVRMNSQKSSFEVLKSIIRIREISSKGDFRVELKHAEKFLYQYLASMMASRCLHRNQPIQSDIYRLYEASLDSDLTSSRLKLASMMYCSGQYERAELVLAITEGLLHADVWQFTPCEKNTLPKPTPRFLEKVYNYPVLEMIKRHVSCCVAFNALELCCVPKFLVYEMHRTIGPDDIHDRRLIVENWMDLIVIDSKPFLFYLQYLTFRQLGQQENKRQALDKLLNYVCVESRACGNIDTALHVLGHCYELENQYKLTWSCYRKSLELLPYNNAARWHMALACYREFLKQFLDNNAGK
ncbi:uncharacterized protein LOC128226857 [Mya arenaria]|uniref:uncharacterized protein LOC128226857 n=1 Tax=Mya arenaria TaxID=6604 RepID=UPI0022E56630|nr:uncharacterized protein LOC128226857 [Mya arenaria]